MVVQCEARMPHNINLLVIYNNIKLLPMTQK
jgi:hypothetical protein